MSNTYTFRVSQATFAKGVTNAKKFGGAFNPATKTWRITLNRFKTPGNLVDQPGLYGLVLVSGEATVQHDHNCDGRFGGACECDAMGAQ